MRFKTVILLVAVVISSAFSVLAQENKDNKPKEEKPPPAALDLTKEQVSGMQVAESAILVYSGLRGRGGLDQVRKTTVEIGKNRLIDARGKERKAEYRRRMIRGKDLNSEKVRLDLKFPGAEYALVYDGSRIFGLINNATFTPRDDAAKKFQNEIWHGLEALLRYKENESKVELEKTEKIMGVEFYVVRVTDKENRSTVFYASKKSLRVMMLEYEEDGVKYRRKFYDHNYAQGTLVPYRTVLWADGKEAEESKISTITFGQIVDEGLFLFNSP